MGIITQDKESLDPEFKLPEFLKKINLETIFIIIFLIFMLNFISVYEGAKLVHGSPYQLIAGDMFTFGVYAEVAKDVNNYTTAPPYLAAGYADVPELFPPIPGILEAELSLFSGAESYDIVLHMNLIMLMLMMAGIYLALRYINKNIAIAGVILGLLIWKWPFSYIINWGAQLSVFNMFFTVGTLLAFLFLKEKYMFIIFGIMNAAGFLSHGREFQTFNLAVVLFFFLQWLVNKFNLKEIDWTLVKNYAYSLILTVALLFRYIPIWNDYGGPNLKQQTFGEFFKFCPLDSTSYHYVSFQSLGIFKWLVIIGIIFGLYLLFTKLKKNTALPFVIIYSLTYIISSYFCIYGNKTTQIRHFFPIFLIPLLGIGIYYLISMFKNKIKEKNIPIIIAAIAVALLVFALVNYYPSAVPEYPVSNPLTWQGIKWIEQNAELDSKVLILYGDNFNQESMFFLMKRPWFRIINDNYLERINSGIVTPNQRMKSNILGFHFKRISLFNLSVISYTGPNGEDLKTYDDSICNYTHIFSNKGSTNQIINAYTVTLLNALIAESKFVPVFQNDLMVILKNNNVGGPCFGEKAFP